MSQEDETYVEEERYGYNDWTDYMWCYRAGVGTQSSLYGEAGISRLRYVYDNVGQSSEAQYFSVEWTPTILPDKPRNIYGFKLGWEINIVMLALAAEIKYQTDFELDGWVATPKVGFGMFGMVNLYYGYNIWLNTNPFDEIRHHQL